MDPIISFYPAERQQTILDMLKESGRVSVNDLCRQFGVSEVTIRADLKNLAEQNLLIRTHGGAVSVARPELSLIIRSQQQVLEKERIGLEAARMISDGECVFLDTSSTSLVIARLLKRRRELTILTNSLAIAQILLDAPGVTVVMPGGRLRRDTVSLIGGDGLEILKKYNIQRGFFGAHGISFSEGLTDVSSSEAEVKRGVICLCREIIAVLDATKWGRVGAASFAELREINEIISNHPVPPELAEQVHQLGVKLTVV
ncbi:MAG: DeoR/GlpR family DNA-binding transcription regulator [Anaerolineae bacterium]|nr:DeoR/GlpR family DNA-binding transcription regulator [Anaerolineae bacterium]